MCLQVKLSSIIFLNGLHRKVNLNTKTSIYYQSKCKFHFKISYVLYKNVLLWVRPNIGVDLFFLILKILIVFVIDYYWVRIIRQFCHYHISYSFQLEYHHLVNVNTIRNFTRPPLPRSDSFHQLFVESTLGVVMILL